MRKVAMLDLKWSVNMGREQRTCSSDRENAFDERKHEGAIYHIKQQSKNWFVQWSWFNKENHELVLSGFV